MSDRRDLNRAFPGSPNGSVAAIVAAAVFKIVGDHCTHLVDLHTGSNFRTNLPQIRVDTKNEKALALARAFGTGVIVHGAGPDGSLRREAMKAGVVSVIYEAGAPYVFQRGEIEHGVTGVQNVMRGLGMVEGGPVAARGQMLRNAAWVRVPRGHGGVFMPTVRPGDAVSAQATIATIADPLTDDVFEVRAPRAGVVVGMALPQVVLSGYGLFHIGELIEAD
jgi:predicted deacylase